jgi:uncharacterized membrane protein YdbT with pleckstrin-like domain
MKLLLQPNETLELDIKTAFVVWLPKFILCAVVIVLLFLFMFPLFNEGEIGIAIFCIILFLDLFFGLRVFIKYDKTRLVITSQRVIAHKQSGLFESLTREIPIESIESVSVRVKGIFSVLFRYGKLKFETRGQAKALVFGAISKPALVQEFIYGIMRDKKL